jgi:hypothetical protein
MAKQRGSYPYPIVDFRQLDVASEFSVGSIRVETTPTLIKMSFESKLTDPDLWRHFKARNAGLRVRLSCTATMLVELVEASSIIVGEQSISWELTVPQNKYSGHVSAEFLIVALVDLPAFKFELQHAEYGDTTFYLKRGDVLANGGNKTFDIEKWYDPLNPPLESFIKIIRKPEATGKLEVDFSDDDVIKVLLPSSAHTVLGPRQSLFQSTLIGLTVAPALIYVLAQVKSEDAAAAYMGKTWYKSLSTLVKKHGVEGEDPIDQVQAILNLPFTHGISLLDESVKKIEAE